MEEQALFCRLNELPRLRQILQELLEMVNQNDVEFGELTRKISMEQVLSARLLRLANSAHFGGSRTVASINDAVIRVGSGSVRTMVIASVLSSAFPKINTLDLTQYWADTFEIALITSKLGSATKLDANSTFTIGILHNIGLLMIHSLVPKEALKIRECVESGEDEIEAQRHIIHTDANVLGAKLAKAWKFPDEMVDAIAFSAQPDKALLSPKLARVLHFARDIHYQWDILTEKEKLTFLAEHSDSRILSISASFAETVDSVRGRGRDLAEQLMKC
ncbi:HDOD domain-containing protein [Vibrio sp. S12_S33]|uniref:HDOD domain-containing protein n=1 Tax=Vibrio sp. S12_S33 TaxID=2720223 RepID=UPI00177DC172|nr:HDOD domain-containing protein [Vibrio sp. S12_S33]MBD1567111.1 HDOD domain-containing protein [Vibrio sp. S12_S33]